MEIFNSKILTHDLYVCSTRIWVYYRCEYVMIWITKFLFLCLWRRSTVIQIYYKWVLWLYFLTFCLLQFLIIKYLISSTLDPSAASAAIFLLHWSRNTLCGRWLCYCYYAGPPIHIKIVDSSDFDSFHSRCQEKETMM